jgi:hypothetical protein
MALRALTAAAGVRLSEALAAGDFAVCYLPSEVPVLVRCIKAGVMPRMKIRRARTRRCQKKRQIRWPGLNGFGDAPLRVNSLISGAATKTPTAFSFGPGMQSASGFDVSLAVSVVLEGKPRKPRLFSFGRAKKVPSGKRKASQFIALRGSGRATHKKARTAAGFFLLPTAVSTGAEAEGYTRPAVAIPI